MYLENNGTCLLIFLTAFYLGAIKSNVWSLIKKVVVLEIMIGL